MYVRHIPERPGAGRLGRHVRHDPRSRRYQIVPRSLGELASVRHHRYIPVLDQGSIGSCTGNAALGAVGTGALYEALNRNVLQPSAVDAEEDEQRAVALYSAATRVDEYGGAYPPDDTGSSGLGVAKACKAVGLISGYRHAMGLEAALTALAAQAVITGVNWYETFDEPDARGLIVITRDAAVRGGHEIVLDELDAENRLIWLTNSWGPSWGVSGRACMSWDTFGRLLDEDGDVTVFAPVTEPAPQPSPGAEDRPGCLSVLARLFAGRKGTP